MPKSSGMRKIVETHSHLRESQTGMAMFPSPGWIECRNIQQGLYRPHSGKATVTRTGTLPPSSCGKGPNAVGESVRGLPGMPSKGCPQGLMGKGHDLQCVVQSRRSSRSTGKLCTGRRAAVQGTAGIQRTWKRQRWLKGFLPLMVSVFVGPRRKVSEKTTLEGKPDAVKAACPVWEGALRNRLRRLKYGA